MTPIRVVRRQRVIEYFMCFSMLYLVLLQFYSNSITRADGSRSGYVKTTLLISIVLFPKYFIITK